MTSDRYEDAAPLLEAAARDRLRRLGLSPRQESVSSWVHAVHCHESRHYFIEPGGAAALEPAAWDSAQIRARVATLTAFVLDRGLGRSQQSTIAKSLVSRAIGFARQERHDLLVVRVPLEDVASIGALEWAGFRLADVQSPLAMTPARAPAGQALEAGVEIDEGSSADLDAVMSFGTAAFATSRFYADPRISEESADRLHAAWLANDFGGRARVLLVARRSGKVCGFVAGVDDPAMVQHLGLRRGHVDLIAVAPDHRNLGLGRALMREAMRRFVAQHAAVLTISTQATNLAAIRLYLRMGYVLSGFEATLHGWVDELGRERSGPE